MSTLVVLGTQWGDEGKGKVVHFLGKYSDYIVRFQGGPNAGHTIILDGKPFVLHTIPSGIVLPKKICYITNGVVFDPEILAEEVRLLEEQNISVKGRLFISPAAHVILPYHKVLDELREKGRVRIGTTRRGIGPAYADKVVRIGIRACDFVERDTFFDLLDKNFREKMPFLKQLVSVNKLRKEIEGKYEGWKKFMEPMIADTSLLLNEAVKKGKNVLFESSQGTLLDLDFGTYPYVTSSNPTSGGACTGSGVPPTKINYVLGVLKAYTTRVGEGPFPTELAGEIGKRLREKGLEYGATTGRPRRCGWFDAVIVRHSMRINGVDSLALTKLDCLEGIDPLRICVAYRYKGKLIREYPYSRQVLDKCEPVYIDMPGFTGNIRNMKSLKDIPAAAKNYIAKIEKLIDTKVSIISMGRSKEETILVDKNIEFLK